MINTVVRGATKADQETIVEFNCAMALETEDKILLPHVISAGVASLLNNPGHGSYWVAQTSTDGKEQIIGSLLITFEWSDWRNGMFWWVQSVYVRPEYRGKGVYRSLYNHVRTMAEADPGVCGFRLYVEQENTRAQQTYESLGMIKTHYQMYEELKPGIIFCKDD